ncbi:lipoprotein [Paenibacillus sp. JCM 10914]|uniref:hypothetical protein n=1 Tax=Paenibacillus sp. JCM 10914 TaxID=1236974 RepID=UPI0003CC261C|nr:hypothetical protein [Paenibacillus sp. JCM 10914]GAE05188.1 lipoprotein, putative [Paenibacillus sp. JCM 10914]
MNRLYRFLPFAAALLIVIWMYNDKPDKDPTEKYDGDALVIGVIGEVPEIREQHIRFRELTLDHLVERSDYAAGLDAIFITNEKLPEAAEPRFAAVFKSANIPFFFIGAEKGHFPYIDEELSFEDMPDHGSGMYGSGYYQLSGKEQVWGFGLYNDTISDWNVRGMYSRILGKIETIKLEGI